MSPWIDPCVESCGVGVSYLYSMPLKNLKEAFSLDCQVKSSTILLFMLVRSYFLLVAAVHCSFNVVHRLSSI